MGYPARPFSDLAMLWLKLRGLKQNITIKDAGRLRCPLLVIHGSEDKISTASDSQMIADASSNGQLYTSKGAGHGDAHLVNAQAHDEVIRDFVNQHLVWS